MADFLGPLRPSDSWSMTEVRTLQHNHVWTIKGFSQCDCRYLETSVKIQPTNPVQAAPGGGNDSSIAVGGSPAVQNQLTFRIRLHPQGNKESNKDFTFFQVFCNSATAKYRAKFAVYNNRNEEIATTVYNGTQQLHGYFEYIRRDLLIGHVAPEDELQLVLNLNITFDTVTKSSQAVRQIVNKPETRQMEVAENFEKFYEMSGERLTDFQIVVGDKDLMAHKAVLAARSPVFSAMLEPHTEEFLTGRVEIHELDYDVMKELLYYIYSGRSPNLHTMAFDLLAGADRFALTGLKEMSEQVLRNNMSPDTVCQLLILADMHDSLDLKNEAIKYIAVSSNSVIHTEGWNQMVKQHPDLVTEVVSAISIDQQPGNSGSQQLQPAAAAQQPVFGAPSIAPGLRATGARVSLNFGGSNNIISQSSSSSSSSAVQPGASTSRQQSVSPNTSQAQEPSNKRTRTK